jgi:hypothetical protein
MRMTERRVTPSSRVICAIVTPPGRLTSVFARKRRVRLVSESSSIESPVSTEAKGDT